MIAPFIQQHSNELLLGRQRLLRQLPRLSLILAPGKISQKSKRVFKKMRSGEESDRNSLGFHFSNFQSFRKWSLTLGNPEPLP